MERMINNKKVVPKGNKWQVQNAKRNNKKDKVMGGIVLELRKECITGKDRKRMKEGNEGSAVSLLPNEKRLVKKTGGVCEWKYAKDIRGDKRTDKSK